MKERVSATIDGETSRILDKLMKNGKYRNKSHVIEEAIKFFEENHNEK
ncbi:MAG: ribbon-helix-helix domain-containing protein [archaeon]